jgi:hypothetical protein
MTISITMRPSSGMPTPEWQSRCKKILIDLQAYLMGR